MIIEIYLFGPLGQHLHLLCEGFKVGTSQRKVDLQFFHFLFFDYLLKFLFQPLNLSIQTKIGLFNADQLAFGELYALFYLIQLLF